MPSFDIMKFATLRKMDIAVAQAVFEAAGHDVIRASQLADDATEQEQFLINDRAFAIAGRKAQILNWGLHSSALSS